MSHTGEYNKSRYQYVDTVSDLAALCNELAGAPYVAVDTEFLRENTYYPELCLVQIKHGDTLACIDTPAIGADALGPLSDLLNNNSITKVLHSASQDMEIFFMLDKRPAAPVFDTQVAAPLLGYNEQIGYGNLVKEVLSVTLAKAHTRADWSRRPIPENQLHYALDDVIYLEQLYLKLSKRLEKAGRLEWLDNDFEDLSRLERYNKPAKNMWQKLRSAQFLKGTQLATLQALAEWREITARETNRPRTWILKDDALTDLAKQRPSSIKELSHLRSIGARTRDKHGEQLIKLIEANASAEPVPLPEFVKKKKLDPAAQSAIDVLTAVVSIKALEHNINASQLASKKMLEACWSAGDSSPLSGWQLALLGDDIDNCLKGRSAPAISDGKGVIVDVD